MLIAPSWGGMINGLLTLRGAWDKLRTDTILKFFVVGITFYGMSTFEGPMLSLRSVNALAHYTDYIIGHVHGGALGWNGFIAFGMIYWMAPRLWKVAMYSNRMMAAHFWLGTLGIVLYMTAMWTSGITQGLMWKEFTEQGTLAYPAFIETVTRLKPFYLLRLLGGTMYLVGVLLGCFNVIMTIWSSRKARVDLADPVYRAPALVWEKTDYSGHPNAWHHKLEGMPVIFSVLVLVAIIIGGAVQIIPMLAIRTNIPTIAAVKPYTPLEVEGRDIYIREGCYTCHSQMIRPFRDEVVRYGEYSKAGEFVYDHPFQFGSKRTGPDLHRVGKKYPDMWHYKHMLEPATVTPGSIMPPYPWLYDYEMDLTVTARKLGALRATGVPYSDAQIKSAVEDLKIQAGEIASELIKQGAEADQGLEKKEIVAMIAYLQRLGTDIKGAAR
jgi:cytochrome c oxidase cbb3-type subunit I/II